LCLDHKNDKIQGPSTHTLVIIVLFHPCLDWHVWIAQTGCISYPQTFNCCRIRLRERLCATSSLVRGLKNLNLSVEERVQNRTLAYSKRSHDDTGSFLLIINGFAGSRTASYMLYMYMCRTVQRTLLQQRPTSYERSLWIHAVRQAAGSAPLRQSLERTSLFVLLK